MQDQTNQLPHTPQKTLMTLKDVAKHIGRSVSWCRQNWPSWVDFGVRPIRANGNPKGWLMFRRDEIDKMVEEWKM